MASYRAALDTSRVSRPETLWWQRVNDDFTTFGIPVHEWLGLAEDAVGLDKSV